MDQPNPASFPSAPRRARKKARTRRAIFDAAMALFAEHGFDAVTIEQICAAADVARGTFFLHYSSKAALLFAWSRELAQEVGGRLREPRRSALSEYRTLVEYLGDHWQQRSSIASALARELLASPDAAELCDLRDVVEDVVRRGQQRGELRHNVSPRLAAVMFLTTCAAALSGAVHRDGRVTPQELRDELLHALLHGLHEPKPRIKWSPG